MARGIDIHPDLVSGLVPLFRDPDVLELAHDTVEADSPFFRFAHNGLVTSLHGYTPYDDETISAVSQGVKAYEVMGVNAGEVVPTEFALALIANFGENHNFGIDLAETMDRSTRDLITRYPHLAQGLLDLCRAQVKDPSPRLIDYAFGGAATMWAVHSEADDFWRFERDFSS